MLTLNFSVADILPYLYFLSSSRSCFIQLSLCLSLYAHIVLFLNHRQVSCRQLDISSLNYQHGSSKKKTIFLYDHNTIIIPKRFYVNTIMLFNGIAHFQLTLIDPDNSVRAVAPSLIPNPTRDQVLNVVIIYLQSFFIQNTPPPLCVCVCVFYDINNLKNLSQFFGRVSQSGFV